MGAHRIVLLVLKDTITHCKPVTGMATPYKLSERAWQQLESETFVMCMISTSSFQEQDLSRFLHLHDMIPLEIHRKLTEAYDAGV